MTIQKFTGDENRALLKMHASVLYQWAAQTTGPVTPTLKEALLATASRLFEVLEGLPDAKEKKKAN